MDRAVHFDPYLYLPFQFSDVYWIPLRFPGQMVGDDSVFAHQETSALPLQHPLYAQLNQQYSPPV
jgi:hypothetical protein